MLFTVGSGTRGNNEKKELEKRGKVMRFALIPWSNGELQDRLFYLKGNEGELIPRESAAYQMWQEFSRLGHELHTYDYYSDWETVDYFLLFSIEWIAAEKIVKAGYGDRLIYCNAEPPAVCELHTREGYELLKQIFPCILTWNPDWVDGRQIFKRCIPYFYKFSPCTIPFHERKLITGISANKHSSYPDELYTERERAYTFFETYYPDQFDFYGVMWEGSKHACYRGTVDSKPDTFHKYKFAICFENTRTRRDYITEKIWDCLTAQIVPVYAGAENIRDYIPESCFIDFYRFSSYEDLAEYLQGMKEEEYQRYIDAAKKLLQSDIIQRFSGEQYARDILQAVGHVEHFQMSQRGRKYLKAKSRKERLVREKIRLQGKVKQLFCLK